MYVQILAKILMKYCTLFFLLVNDITELEQLIHVQNDLLDKLRNECKALTEKLEESTQKTK